MLEIGSWQGRSTICMAQSAKRVVALDTFQGDDATGRTETLNPFLQHLQAFDLRDRVQILVGCVSVLGPHLAAGRFDMVFIDGSHDEFDVQRDTDLAVRVVNAGGVVVWHDWNMGSVTNGVKRALGRPEGREIDGTTLYVWER